MDIKPQIKEEKQTGFYGEFVIEPLPRGYGTTLGNALRRVMLSSLPGAAITSVKVEGVFHEFSTLPGVLESMTEILLNLKKVRFAFKADEPQVLVLKQQGPKEVIAGDIETNPFVHVINREQHIATLTNRDASLTMELTVSLGTGFMAAHRRPQPHEIGVINLDAIFSPVRKVNVIVEDTRVGQATDFNRLILQVETDGSLQPRDAVRKAARILVNYFTQFLQAEGNGEISEQSSEELARLLKKSIEEMGFSNRTRNCLKKTGIETVHDLVKARESDLLAIENFGKTSLEEVKRKLEELGLSLKP